MSGKTSKKKDKVDNKIDAETQTDVGLLLSSNGSPTQNIFIISPELMTMTKQQEVIKKPESPKTNIKTRSNKTYNVSDQEYYLDDEEDYEEGEYDEDEDDGDYEEDEEDWENDGRDNPKESYTSEDMLYYEKLPKKKRKTIDGIEKDIKNIDFFITPMRFRILESDMDLKLKALAIQKVDELANMYPGSGEYFKLKNWIESLCKLPIGKVKNLPVKKGDHVDDIAAFMEAIRTKFDELIYGHQDAKDQIIQLLAKLISNPSAKGVVIGLVGPMGVGKTMMSQVLAEVLGMPMGFISLAGANGDELFKGFSYTYEASRYGKIADIIINTGYMNPILFFDELDKISTSSHGDEVTHCLIHMTDFTQNDKFQDLYFGNINLDLSKCIFIFSYNHEENVNIILKDRLTTIHVKEYNMKDKIKLAQNYMMPKILTEFGFGKGDLVISDEIIEEMIGAVNEEAGVRNLKRGLEELVGSVNYMRILGKIGEKELPFTMTPKHVKDMLIINRKKADDDNFSKHMMYM